MVVHDSSMLIMRTDYCGGVALFGWFDHTCIQYSHIECNTLSTYKIVTRFIRLRFIHHISAEGEMEYIHTEYILYTVATDAVF